jgi:hypothetical protein
VAPHAIVHRHGTTVFVSWKSVPQATYYAVGLRLGDGRGVSHTVAADKTMFTGVPVTDRLTATIYPVMSDGVTGPTATVARKAKRISDLGFVGIDRSNGAFTLTPGKTYTLRVLATKHPIYVDAAPVPAKPHGGNFPFTAAGERGGTPRWTMRVHLPSDIADNFHYWVIGVKVGRKTYDVKIHVLPPKHRSARILTIGGAATGSSSTLAVTTFTNGTMNFGLPASN